VKFKQIYQNSTHYKLLVFERRILKRIFGPTQKADGEWRLKTNEEVENAIRYENIVRHIKSKRLSWLGHVKKCQTKEWPRLYKMETIRNKTERKAKIKMGRRREK
jgi:hypothetical protein